MGPMGELGALFNPGMRHELEERRSKAMRREEEGNARDGDLRIDLESGVAVIAAVGDENESGSTTDGDENESGSTAEPSSEVGDDHDSGGPAGSDHEPARAASAAFDTPVVSPAVVAAETDPAGTDVGAPDSEGAAAEVVSAPRSEAPAVLRPRGKRGVAAGRT